MREFDLVLRDGRTLHAYDREAVGSPAPLTVVWHHGTPNIGLPPEPLFPVSDRLGIRWVAYDRPGYGGSSPRPDRTVGSAADDVAAITDALGVERFAVVGHSGGASHALACGALLPERVAGVVSIAALAPFDAVGLDWFGGMSAAGAASLTAAAAGREAKARYEATAPEADPGFIAADHAELRGAWAWLGKVVGPALKGGPGGLIDDDLAYVTPWGFEPSDIRAPTMLLHGARDRIVPSAHGVWLARRAPSAELRLTPDDGHISVLRHAGAALESLRERTG